MNQRESELPLTGHLVVELASVLAGPSAGQYLAELGATVIKVENARTGGDVTRSWLIAGESSRDDRSAYFCCCNWGKRSIAIDLANPESRAIVDSLVRKADVVISSYRPGSASKLGVDVERLRALNPNLVHLSITGYGESDDRAGYDAALQAESGFMHLNGYPDGPPTKMPVALIDLLAAHQAKEAVLVGLLQRMKTGTGSAKSVSLMDSALSSLANQASGWLQAGIAPQRIGSAHPSIAPYGTPYKTKDGAWLAIAVGTDNQFKQLATLLGLDGLAAEKRFAINARRVDNRAELEARLANAIATLDVDFLESRLSEARIPCSRIATVPQALDSVAARRLTLKVEDESGDVSAIRQSVSSGLLEIDPPPHYGEHTTQILSELLGFEDSTISGLLSRGVVRQSR